ncbi:hypothetical protein ABIE44_000556 [Marmoricola sp. OAE513]
MPATRTSCASRSSAEKVARPVQTGSSAHGICTGIELRIGEGAIKVGGKPYES